MPKYLLFVLVASFVWSPQWATTTLDDGRHAFDEGGMAGS
jgi:hypothetical protein